MNWLAIALLLSQQATLPPPVEVQQAGDWIGTLEMTSDVGLRVARTDVRLVFSDKGEVTGSWRTPGGATGNILGTFKDGQFKLAITFYGGAEREYADGTIEKVAVERCKGEAQFTGTLLRTGVIRITSRRISFSDEIKKAKNTDCNDERNLTWLLQPHTH